MAEELGFRIKIQGAEQQIAALTEIKTQVDSLANRKKFLNNQVKELAAQFKSGAISSEEFKTRSEQLANQQVQNQLAQKQATAAYREGEKALLQSSKATKAADGSLASLRIKLAQNKKAWTELSAAERNNAAVGGELLKTIQAQDKEVKDLEKSIGVTTRNVGNYGEAFSAATPLMGAFGSKVMQLQTAMKAVQTVLQKTVAATTANTAATTANTSATGANTTTTAANTTAQNANTATTRANTQSQNANTTATTANTTATRAMTAATRAATIATSGISKALKIFRLALISTGIGAIVVALGTLITAVASTQRGIDALSRFLEPLKETFATLFGIIQDVGLRVFGALKNAIKDPIGAMKSFANAVKTNIVNRFQGAVNLVSGLARGLVSSINLMGLGVKKALADVPLFGAGIDQEKLKKDLAAAKAEAIKISKEIAVATAQVATGLDKAQQQALATAAKATGAELAKAKQRAKEIANLEIEISKGAIDLEKNRQRALRTFEEQKEIAQDVLKSDKERIAAAAEAKRQLQIAADLQTDQLQKEIRLLKLKTEANDTDREALKEISEKEAQLEAVQAANIKKRILLGNTANAIVKRRNALNEKAAAAREKELAKLEAAQEKADENELQRKFKTEQEILKATEDRLKMEAELEAATTDQTEAQKIQSAIELEKKLAEIRLQSLSNQATEIERQEKALLTKIETLRKESGGKETVEIINLTDKLNAKKLEREKIQGEQTAAVKLQNQINEEALLKEQRTIADEEENERIAEREEIRNQIKSGAIEAVDTVAQTAFQGQQRRIKEDQAREIAALEAKKQAGVITQQEFEKQRKEIDRQAFERQKKADTSRAVINGALAIGKTFAQLGFTPAAGVAVALGAVKTAAEIATIQAQKFEGFADGGFTGNGFGSPDSSGHRVAGVVHANEYVVPKKVLETTAGAALVGNLERMRMKRPTTNVSRGFIGGGFTSGGEFPSMDDLTANLIEGVSGAIQSIPVVNNATETESVARSVNNIENEASFS